MVVCAEISLEQVQLSPVRFPPASIIIASRVQAIDLY